MHRSSPNAGAQELTSPVVMTPIDGGKKHFVVVE
jgi:hypothetical protein